MTTTDFLDELIAERGAEVALAVENGVRLRRLVRELAEHRRERGISRHQMLHEDLLGIGEADDRPRHPQISQVAVPPLRPRDIWSVGEPAIAVARRMPDISIAEASRLPS